MSWLTVTKLLSLFKRLNLSSLPSANPGNGNPWLHSSGSIVVGAFTNSISSSNVTDFSEAVDDRVAALLVAGSNVTINYNDAGNQLTISASGGGGGTPGGSTGQLQYNNAGAFAGFGSWDGSQLGVGGT
ncbi:MAG: hypothetical protein U0894_20860, partial [Pirellulales bacterium]